MAAQERIATSANQEYGLMLLHEVEILVSKHAIQVLIPFKTPIYINSTEILYISNISYNMSCHIVS